MYRLNVDFRLKNVLFVSVCAAVTLLSPPSSAGYSRTLSFLDDQCMRGRGDGFNACEEMGDYYMNEKPRDDWQDRAIHAYKRGCHNASDRKVKGASCEKVAMVLGDKYSGVITNFEEIHKFHAKACKLNFMIGCANQGKDLSCGVGVQMNKSKGMSLIEKACNKGIMGACDWLKDGVMGCG